MPRYRILVLALCAGLFGACSSETDSAVPEDASVDPLSQLEERARQFLEALAEADPGAVEPFLTERARQGLAGGGSWQIDGQALESWEVISIHAEGEHGEVAVDLRVSDATQHIRFDARCEEQQWFFVGMTVELEGGGAWPVDFEAMADLAETIGSGIEPSLGDWRVDSRERQGVLRRARFTDLDELTIPEHDERWQIDVVAADRPVSDVLVEVLSGTGVEFERRRELDAHVSCELSGVSRLFAVEWLAREVGLQPVYPHLADSVGGLEEGMAFEISFLRGVRDGAHPAVACGPFLVEVVGITEEPQQATGVLELSVRALGIAPEALALCGDMREFIVVDGVDGVEGAAAADLRANPGMQYWTRPEARDGYFQADLAVDLRGLLRGVEAIDQITGFVQFALPVGVVGSELPVLAAGAEERRAKVGSWGIVQSVREGSQYFELRSAGLRMSDVSLLFDPRDGYGDPVDVSFESGIPVGDMFQGQLQLNGEAKSIAVKIAETRTLAYPFEFGRLPLTAFADQPATERTLDFDGAAPLVVAFGGFAEREEDRGLVMLELTNRSNKHIASALVRFVYLDAFGVVIGDSPHSLAGEYSIAGSLPLVDSGAARSSRFAVHFMPNGTQEVRVQVDALKFQDASTWDRSAQ